MNMPEKLPGKLLMMSYYGKFADGPFVMPAPRRIPTRRELYENLVRAAMSWPVPGDDHAHVRRYEVGYAYHHLLVELGRASHKRSCEKLAAGRYCRACNHFDFHEHPHPRVWRAISEPRFQRRVERMEERVLKESAR